MSEAPGLLKMNHQALRELRDRCERDMYFFAKAIWFDRDIDQEMHGPVFDWLREDWKRGVLSMFRGSLKSSIMRAYVMHRGLFTTTHDYNVLYVMNRAENAQIQNEKVQDKFKFGPQSQLLLELFQDPKVHPDNPRIPEGFEGWNTKQTLLVKRDANSDDFFTFAGLDSKLESIHKRELIGDDLEGADADRSDAPNEVSEDFVKQRAEQLLERPAEDRIIIVGTPHGASPLVHKLKRLQPHWAVHWRPIRDETTGKPAWPQRFSEEYIHRKEALSKIDPKERRNTDMQLKLLERSAGQQTFNMDVITAHQYWLKGYMLGYHRLEYEAPSAENNWQHEGEMRPAWVNLAFCNRYIHIDPLHKDPDTRRAQGRRPSQWAMVVTATAPDFHTFVLEEWIEDASFDVAVEKYFVLYRKWRPRATSFEAIGAQTWWQHHIRMLEKNKYRGLRALPMPWAPVPTRLPMPSSRMVEVDKDKRLIQEKEPWIVEQLELPHNLGLLHLNSKRTPILWKQHEDFGVTEGPIDGVDALAQGPGIWKTPIDQRRQDELRFRGEVERIRSRIDPLTGYARPWSEEAA